MSPSLILLPRYTLSVDYASGVGGPLLQITLQVPSDKVCDFLLKSIRTKWPPGSTNPFHLDSTDERGPIEIFFFCDFHVSLCLGHHFSNLPLWSHHNTIMGTLVNYSVCVFNFHSCMHGQILRPRHTTRDLAMAWQSQNYILPLLTHFTHCTADFTSIVLIFGVYAGHENSFQFISFQNTKEKVKWNELCPWNYPECV